MKIAVLGSGNGGCAVAFDYASRGHGVRLFDFEAFSHNIRSIKDNGGICATGELTGYAPVEYAGHQIEKALHEAQVIFAVGPAYSTKAFAKACQPHLRKGQTVIVCPGSCAGSIVFKQEAGLAIRDEKIIVAETSTLPYAVRLEEPGKIKVHLKLKGGLFLAAVPAGNTPQVMKKIQDVYPGMMPAKNVLQTSLQNGNPVIHPTVSLMNAALIERTGGDFCFYEDGVTPAVGRLMEAIDAERVAIGKKLGVEVIPDPELGLLQGYMVEPTYTMGYASAPGFKGIKAQNSLDYRYFHEDVGYGLVFMQSLAGQVGVDTPYISAIIKLVSLIMNRDYQGEAKRTMAALGLATLSATELERLLA